MNQTGIIWSEVTWNPFSGCVKVSQGCKHCYAETLAEQRRGSPAFKNGFDLTLRPHKLKEPLKLKEPTLIFANSMSDLFWDQVPNEYRHQVIDIIDQTPQHEYQVLTKRPDLMLKFSRERKLPSNFWAGVSIEDTKNLHRLDILKQVEAEIRFISFEPLLEQLPKLDLSTISWAITGGESGHHLWKGDECEKRGLVRYNQTIKKWEVREDRIIWITSIRDNCQEYGTKFFHKQWGGHYPEAAGRLLEGKYYSEMPRLPGQNKTLNNEYLKLIESGKLVDKRDELIEKSIKK